MKLFVLTTDGLKLDRAEVALFKEFNAILRRDKSSSKVNAFDELNYVYQMCDKFSYVNQLGLSGKEADMTAKDLAGLPVDYTPDELVFAAMRRYREARPSQLERIATELRSAFNTSYKVVKALRLRIERVIDDEEIKSEDFANVVASLKELLSLGETIPKRISSISEIEKLIEMEDKDFDLQRGGKKIEDSMNPDTAIG